MKITDTAWKEIWFKEKYEPISNEYLSRGFGTDKEPESSVCMASFANAMGTKFRDGITLLDYGCGSARFCNFMSRRLKDFLYYGVEKPGSFERWGEKAITYAHNNFGHDNRICLGFVGDNIEKEAIEKAEVALLLSIFTHLTIEDMNAIMDKLMPIILRGGSIIFSLFIGEAYITGRDKVYGFKDCYSEVYYTKEQIEAMAQRLNIKIDKKDVFKTPRGHKHIIFNAHKI
ncbi:hypothetical protein ACFL29_02255 [Patescibacteria group bacterium]